MNELQVIERLRQVLRRQHKALATEDAYVLWLRRYISALRQMPHELTSEKKMEKFLTDLACKRDVSASTQNQAFNAILFFYQNVLEQPLGNVRALRATRPVHERHAPTVAETQLLLQTVRNQGGYPTNLIARMLYGCGLRVCRCRDAPTRIHEPMGLLQSKREGAPASRLTTPPCRRGPSHRPTRGLP
jgi:integrase